jgi:hypothetical protein
MVNLQMAPDRFKAFKLAERERLREREREITMRMVEERERGGQEAN